MLDVQEPLVAEAGPVPRCSSPLSTWAPKARTHQSRRGSGAERPEGPENREEQRCLARAPAPSWGPAGRSGTAQSARDSGGPAPASGFRYAAHARAAGPRAVSVLVKMATPGVLRRGRGGCCRPRRGRAAPRGRTAPSSTPTTA